MFGKILSVTDTSIIIENLTKKVESTLVGVHIVFENPKNKVVAEISQINSDIITAMLVGEFEGNNFRNGVLNKPTINSKIRIIGKEEVAVLMGNQVIESSDSVYIGKSLIYSGFNVSANLNNLFSNHFAIIGNTGSGKSCFVTRLFQNLFYRRNYVPISANIALFDVYGEYHTALDRINQTKRCRCKTVTTDPKALNNIIKIPPWFLGVDEIALLLNVDTPAQLPIIEKALKLVYLFTEEEAKVIGHKNHIIAKALMDVLTSGKTSTQIRDQVIAVLSTFYTNDINLESKIIQPGYIRTLKQCLNVDQTGKINTIQLVIEFLEKYINDGLKLSSNMKPKFYQLTDLYNAFEFALLSEGVLKSDKVYDTNNILKIRLDSIINGSEFKYFDVKEYITVEDYIDLLFCNERGEKAQIVNFNLNYIDERFAKVFTKIFSKLFFDYSVLSENRGGFPIQIILEEAHRYVQSDNDINTLGYNIFDRITKEGRKYGVILGLITQRPSELSATALSQCSNYIVLRMFHPDDLEIIKNITFNVSTENVEKLKTLGSGVALCFGNAFKIPTFAKIDRADPPPSSSNSEIVENWFKEKTNNININSSNNMASIDILNS